MTSCTDAAVAAAVAAGGSYQFACDGTIYPAATYMIPAGKSLALDADGHKVAFEGRAPLTSQRLFQVSGNLALRGITIDRFQYGGSDFDLRGADGAPGADGTPGAAGTSGASGGPGAVGRDGTPGGAGQDAGTAPSAEGGALYIDTSGNVSLDHVTLSNNLAAGGNSIAGNGGRGGSGGDGGAGGGATGSGGTGGAGGAGGQGATGGKGGTGGQGGDAKGGAIYNGGTLTITNSTLSGNQAEAGDSVGGLGGNGGFGGNGGDGGGTPSGDNDGAGGNAGAPGKGGDGGKAGVGGNEYGGAIYNAGALTVVASDFTGNQAYGGGTGAGGGGSGGNGGYGGTSFNGSPCGVSTAGGDGGAGNFAGAVSTAQGGAIYSTVPWSKSGGSTSGNSVNGLGGHWNGGGFGGKGGGIVCPGQTAPPDGKRGSPTTATDTPGVSLDPDFFPDPGYLSVTLGALDESGNGLDGTISKSQDVYVVETISNHTGSTLHDLSFARDQVLGVEQGTGGLQIVSGPSPALAPGQTLADGASLSYVFLVSATADGRSAVDTKLTALDADNQPRTAGYSLRFDIADGQRLNAAVARFLQIQAADQLLRASFAKWRKVLDARAQDLYRLLAGGMSGAARRRWFGPLGRLSPSPLDFALSTLLASAPDLVAARLPQNKTAGYTAEELQQAYNKAFYDKVGEGVSKYVAGWSRLSDSVKTAVRNSWRQSVLAATYQFGTGTPEERTEFEAHAVSLIDGLKSAPQNFVTRIGRELGDWRANGTYFAQAVSMSVQDATLQSPDLQAGLRQEKIREANWIKNADTDPVAFQQNMAARDAEIFNAGMTAVFDQLVGGGALKLAGAAKGLVVRGAAAGIFRAGESSGVLNAEGEVVRGGPSIPPPDPAVPSGVPAADAASLGTEQEFLAADKDATVIEAKDAGSGAYRVKDLGGVPETVIDAKAQILADLQKQYEGRFGKKIQLVEVLKPGTNLEKEGGVAKLELTEPKTLKPVELDAGLPEPALGEAGVWHSSTNPADLPGFADLGEERQAAAVKAWKKANEAWDAFKTPEPGSKTFRLKQCLGKKCTVPLDPEPNKGGIQRFVTAEYELKTVTQGDAEADLIRVKYYRVEVKDARTGRLLNSKVVVDSPVALPQTPDADAVALGKVVGRKPDGTPLIAPLDRAEREFIYQRYIDKNIKARLSGDVPALAEHGATLVMDDAGSAAAGKLLPRYGAIFLPRDIGFAYLKRIAPFVVPPGSGYTAEQMFQKMIDIVQSEGGFGQKAVVVTADSRYFGEVPFAQW